eukprot:5183136-Alexandrium_andersonii.AAC.1
MASRDSTHPLPQRPTRPTACSRLRLGSRGGLSLRPARNCKRSRGAGEGGARLAAQALPFEQNRFAGRRAGGWLFDFCAEGRPCGKQARAWQQGL